MTAIGDPVFSRATFNPVTYFTAVLAATFGLWLAGAYVSFLEPNHGLHMLLLLPGLMVPAILTAVLTFTGRSPLTPREYRDRLVNPALIRPGMLPFMLLLAPLSVVAAILLSVPFGGSLDQLRLAQEFSFTTGFVPVLVLLFLASTFEELGWRGYAFDSLQSRFGFLTAALIFGVLWSLWHLPLMLVKDSYQYVILQESPWYALNFYLGIVPLGVIISWVCAKNRKSMLAAVLFHFVINLSQETLELTQRTKCIQTVVLAGVAAALVLLDRRLFLSRAPLTASKETPCLG